MKTNLLWWGKLSILIVFYDLIPYALLKSPYAFIGCQNDRQSLKFRTYSDARQKKQEDIIVPTLKGDHYFEGTNEGNHPIPQYSRLPTDEEIKKHGLHAIGKAESEPSQK